MKEQHYQPSPEEIKKAEDMMTPEQKKEASKQKIIEEFVQIASCYQMTLNKPESVTVNEKDVIRNIEAINGLSLSDEYKSSKTMNDLKKILGEKLTELNDAIDELEGHKVNMNYYLSQRLVV